MSIDVSTNAAVRAYELGKSVPVARGTGAEEVSGPSFAEVLESTARKTVEAIHAGDRAAVAGLAGTLPTQQVVEATMAMESALNTTVAVRDKLVEAYQEVLRMAV